MWWPDGYGWRSSRIIIVRVARVASSFPSHTFVYRTTPPLRSQQTSAVYHKTSQEYIVRLVSTRSFLRSVTVSNNQTLHRTARYRHQRSWPVRSFHRSPTLQESTSSDIAGCTRTVLNR